MNTPAKSSKIFTNGYDWDEEFSQKSARTYSATNHEKKCIFLKTISNIQLML